MLRLRWTIQPYQQHIRFSSGLAFVEKWFIYWFLQQIIWQLTQWGEPTSRMQLQWRIIEKQKAFSNNWSRVWWNFSSANFSDCLRVQWNLYIKLHTCFLFLCFLCFYFIIIFFNFYSQFRDSFSDTPTDGEMNDRRNIPFRICKKFCFPCSILLLFSSAVLLCNSHYGRSLFKYSKELIKPIRSLIQNKTALVTLLTNPNKTNSPEVVRAWADVNSASSEVQRGSRPKISTGSILKPALEARPIQRVQPAPSEIKTGSNQEPQSEARSTSGVHSVSSKVRPKKDQEDRSPSEVHTVSHSVQTTSNFRSTNRNFPELQRTFPTSTKSLDVVSTPRPERRRSLLIYGADRSGTTFTTKMFAEDPQLMTVYEPLWITTKWNKEDSSQIPNWTKNVLDLLRGILSCKFAETAAGVKFLSHTSRKWNGAYVKNPFQSQNFCPNWECKDLSSTPKYADTVCLTKYKHSVTKIGEPRTLNSSISSFLPKVFLENPDTDIRVIQLIRDPRASLRSRIKLGWMVDWTHWNFRKLVRKVCSNLVANIKFGRNLGKWQDRYLEVHYHDLAGKPLETTRAMYDFAGFEMPDSIADWVVRNTSPSKEELMKESKNIFSPTRNSTANIDKWKQDSPVERIQIIEKYCKKALDLLGLKKML